MYSSAIYIYLCLIDGTAKNQTCLLSIVAKKHSARICPIKGPIIRWNKYYLIIKCYKWRRKYIIKIWKIETLRYSYSYAEYHCDQVSCELMPQTCSTVDRKNMTDVNLFTYMYDTVLYIYTRTLFHRVH